MQEWRQHAAKGEEALRTASACLATARRPPTPLPPGAVREVALRRATPALLRYAAGDRRSDSGLPSRLSAAILQLNASAKKARAQHATLLALAQRMAVHAGGIAASHTPPTADLTEQLKGLSLDMAPQCATACRDNAASGEDCALIKEADDVTAAQEWALLWGGLAAAVGRECELFDAVAAGVHHATSGEAFEAFVASWSLHPFVDDAVLADVCAG